MKYIRGTYAVQGALCLGLLLNTVLSRAQEQSGIRFDQDGWQAVLAKARVQHKYIFVDCYASWCGPCKLMDRDVYPRKAVGDYMNARFICVKEQMDTSAHDDEGVKQRYADAHMILQKYHITGFPTFLFFSPYGEIVDRGMGAARDSDFITLASNALDPAKQFYTQLDNYRQGNKDYSTMASLSIRTRQIGDREMAFAIAQDYKKNYLDKENVSVEELSSPENLQIIGYFADLVDSHDRYFDLFYRHPDDIDKAARHKGYSEWFVHRIITKEEITSRLWRGDQPITRDPAWEKIRSAIASKYPGFNADVLIDEQKFSFYKRIGNWTEYTRLFDEKIRQHPPVNGKSGAYGGPFGDTWALNSEAWDAFLHCSDKKVLSRALAWSELSIKLEEPDPNVQYLDTRANLLYKLGKRKEAIAQEEKALEIDIRKTKRPNGLFGYGEMIAKMKNGEPTWPVAKNE